VTALFASRPDLIDSALLRPGRLDKSLLCNMPTKEERKEVRTSTENPLLSFSAISLIPFFLQRRSYKRMRERSPYRLMSTLTTSPTPRRDSQALTSRHCCTTPTSRSCMPAWAKLHPHLRRCPATVPPAARTASTMRLSWNTPHSAGPQLRTRSSLAQSRRPRSVG
jgi:hypothetical protein